MLDFRSLAVIALAVSCASSAQTHSSVRSATLPSSSELRESSAVRAQTHSSTFEPIADLAVFPGDFPDPSVVRVGNDYWATATTSAWAPIFPLLHSQDLLHWDLVGAVFKTNPVWASGNYWAPEISYYKGTYFIFYAASKRGGGLCIASASAKQAVGPYTDHGPLACHPAGSIDPAPVIDENGKRFLVWKTDNNSQGIQTPLLAQEISEDGTKLLGTPVELFHNDAAWEGPLIEGPSIVRHGEYFYLFYAGAACCTAKCNYAMGVARSKKLLGPWQKNPSNPILDSNQVWKCPGHGTVTDDPSGRNFILYHAMNVRDSVFVGRQPLVDEILWDGEDGWPTINGGKGPFNRQAFPVAPQERLRKTSFSDDFRSSDLNPAWEWPHDNEPLIDLKAGHLLLAPNPAHAGSGVAAAVLAHRTAVGSYQVDAQLDLGTIRSNRQTAAGLSAYGSTDRAVGISVNGGRVYTWKRSVLIFKSLASAPLPAGPKLEVRLTVERGSEIKFYFREPGQSWQELGLEADGRDLPPWDLGVRFALVAGGSPAAPVQIDWVKMESLEKPTPLGLRAPHLQFQTSNSREGSKR